jgi:predicted transcriptional regulator
MTRVLEDAIAKVRKLPEDRQAYVAEVLEQIAAAGSDLFTVPEDHRAAVVEGLEQAERGEFVSDDEMAARDEVIIIHIRDARRDAPEAPEL